MRAPTGEQYELTRRTPAGEARAVITEVAAGIRTYSIGGIDLTEPFGVDRTPPSADGIVLVPWPNRVKDGLWHLRSGDGTLSAQQLALTEPALHNASHGLLRYSPYRLIARGDDWLQLGATVFPQPGYPFLLETSVTHRLVDDGLSVSHTVTNQGTDDAPVALGAHPYLKIGDVPTEDLVLRLNATTHYEVDDRSNVVAEHAVDGTEYDLRGGARVGDLTIDHGWGGAIVANGRVEHTLTAPDGRMLALWGDENVRNVQAFTHRGFATLPGGSVAIAVEPMTAPANALNTGDGLRWLSPDESWDVRWGIRHQGFARR